MPKITSQKVHRIHLSILESEYQPIKELAKKNNTSISEILRIYIRLLIDSENKEVKVIELNNSKHLKQVPMEF